MPVALRGVNAGLTSAGPAGAAMSADGLRVKGRRQADDGEGRGKAAAKPMT